MNKYLPYKSEEYNSYIERLYPNDLKIRQITFQVTEDCCLACTYCYQNNKSYNILSFDTAKKLIDDILNNKYDYINTSNTKGMVWDFIGGEPFLEINLIGKIVEYIFNSMIELNHPWLYYSVVNLCSNGILYTSPSVQDFFQKYGFLVHLGISIDGNKELHDSCRIDLNGNGSYDRAIEAVKLYRKQFNREAPTKMTLAPSNIQYLSEAVFSLIKEGYRDIRLNCIYESGWTIEHAIIMYQELKIIADYFLENNLYNKIYFSMFEEYFFMPMQESDNENWCGGTSDSRNIAINYTGKIYPCIRYMDSSLNKKQPEIWIGTVENKICSTCIEQNNYQKISNVTRRSQSTDECFYCPIAEGCAWCSAYNYEEFGIVNKRATYICIMHKARALANIYYWNKLYKQLNLPQRKLNYLPDKDSLLIIDKNELNNLKDLVKD